MTANNTGLTLSIAADYGGRWDILQAVNQLIAEGVTEITEEALSRYLMLGDAPEPDCLSEPAARRASVISCCGRWRMRNCIYGYAVA